MTWLVPGAFAAFVLLAGPLIVHLLARRNARRLVFPATHFVRATQAAAVRLRRPSDIGLLVLRLAIVTAAVLAAAQPLVMTRWRLARWNARFARAVVVDTSRSMAESSVAARLADEEIRNVFAGRRVNTPDLSDGIGRAVGWLQTAPPARREIVLVSDFQRGSLDQPAIDAIPADIGVRFIRSGVQPASRSETPAPVSGWRGGIWQATATIDAAGTRVSWARRGPSEVPRWITVLASPADAAAADRALRAAVSPGVAAGDPHRRTIVRFAGAAPLVPIAQPVTTPWIASAAMAPAIRDVEPAVSVFERDGVMVVEAPIAASAFEAPAILRAAILAVRPSAIVDAKAEVVTRPDADLARWRRDPAPVTSSAIPNADTSDGRWFWALGLILLAVEEWLRRISGRQASRGIGEGGDAHADAA
jgi:Aerotolerance regulator N-terminal